MVSAIPLFEQETVRWSGSRRRRSPAGLGVPMPLGKACASSAGANKYHSYREPQAHSFASTAGAAAGRYPRASNQHIRIRESANLQARSAVRSK